MREKKENGSVLFSVDKAIDILVALGHSYNKTIRELSQELGIDKSTIHRILQTLESRGLVKKNNITDKFSKIETLALLPLIGLNCDKRFRSFGTNNKMCAFLILFSSGSTGTMAINIFCDYVIK